MATYELKIDKLEKLLKALKAKPPKCKVGILGKQARGDGELTNAQIGAFHEFGTVSTPVRSFLRVPIATHLQKRMKEAGAFDKNVLAQVLAQGSVVPWVEKVAFLAESIVLEAFDTGGFGLWPPSNMSGKKNHQTLVETGQLRNAISSEVKA